MAWIELHITTSAEHADVLGDQLSLLDALAVTFQDAGDQPIYEPSPDTLCLWKETVVIGLFDAEHPMDAVLNFLEEQEAKGRLKHFHLKHLEDQDWQRVCLDSFKPIQFGQRLWICPSWHTPPAPNAVNVILDPGLAFGTGTHPTTALCLEWLDNHITGNEKLVIDYGCGSGILAIAALKLGAPKVLAIDNDPQALDATRSNGERNHLFSPQLETQISSTPLEKNEENETLADVLIANILAQPLINLAPYLAKRVKSGGKIVLSGILSEQADQVKNAYLTWFNMQKPVFRGEWTRLEGNKL